MAWDNALNQVISDLFVDGPVEASKLPFITNSKWQNIADSSDQVTIITVGSATFGTYDPAVDITIGTGSAEKTVLKCDQLVYFADSVDDSIKLVGDYAVKYGQKAVMESGLKADKYALTLATKANFPTNWYAGAVDAAIDVNSANILAVLEDLNTKMNEANIPDEGRFIAVPPTLNQKILIAIRKAGIVAQQSTDAFYEGKVMKVCGLNIIVTNQYTGSTAIGQTVLCLFGHADAIAYGGKPTVVESARLEKRFADLVKGLYRFGAKVVEEKKGGAAKLKIIAEA